MNALTFDVEEYFQVHRFEKKISINDWEFYDSRIAFQVNYLLDLLDIYQRKATFFVLGWVAERKPQLIKKIYEKGHEIASHGYFHKIVKKQEPDEFKYDIEKSLKILEDIIGDKVIGYRAPSFSIDENSIWAFEILKDNGIKYDSSIFPGNHFGHKRYGKFNFRKITAPFEILDNLLEFPVSVLDLRILTLPLGGGAWFRMIPFSIIFWGLKIRARNFPLVLYFHPWEFDDEQPKIKSNFIDYFVHYSNLRKNRKKLKIILESFDFMSIKSLLKSYKNECSNCNTR
ncbi:MAG: XrtA system polysaccharide deacetylase [Candidatus Helarchaeota archaeon]